MDVVEYMKTVGQAARAASRVMEWWIRPCLEAQARIRLQQQATTLLAKRFSVSRDCNG